MFAEWTRLSDVSYKAGVSGSPSDAISAAISVADSIWTSIGQTLTVTSLRDGTHASGPCGHYYGNAVDLRNRDLTAGQQATVFQKLQQQLPGYTVLWEGDHFHVQTCGAGVDSSTPDATAADPTSTDGQAGSLDLSSIFSDPTTLLLLGLGLFFLLRR